MDRQEILTQMKNFDFDIIVVAGQSNAEGCGLGNEKLIYKKSENIYQLIDCNNYSYIENNGSYKLNLVLPIEMNFCVAEERFDLTERKNRSAFCDTFVKLYEKKYLHDNRKILLIRGAINGSGFSRNEWGKDGVLYNRLKDVIDFSLSANEKNRLVVLLWHQGEHDATEQPQLSYNQRFEYYKQHLGEMLTDFSKRYGENIPIIAGQYSHILLKKEKTQYLAIINATKEVFKTIKFGGIAKSSGIKVNCEVVHDTDMYHFDRKSNIKFGKRYFNIYKRLKKRN